MYEANALRERPVDTVANEAKSWYVSAKDSVLSGLSCTWHSKKSTKAWVTLGAATVGAVCYACSDGGDSAANTQAAAERTRAAATDMSMEGGSWLYKSAAWPFKTGASAFRSVSHTVLGKTADGAKSLDRTIGK